MKQGNFHENKKKSTALVDPFEDVKDFMTKYNQKMDLPKHEDILEFRLRLLYEEIEEFYRELQVVVEEEYEGEKILVVEDIPVEEVDWQNLTKEMSDIIYVIVGMAHTLGLPLKEVFRRVHESNMTKDGSKRDDGKVLKGDTYEPPVLEDLFE